LIDSMKIHDIIFHGIEHFKELSGEIIFVFA